MVLDYKQGVSGRKFESFAYDDDLILQNISALP